ncbi:hypothetical protein THMIRHAT_23660 [Thiosulfativibrio zosterae]|uniref:Uncharacterized protein n=2 Tax=Thiosulfativibrio zosterae TaxID=2675053 RepID=A0A6F8PRK6_9GAMM|nr:hypothetical protein THMIRHAT_23660 [Thiosulfativibrio zosterae]
MKMKNKPTQKLIHACLVGGLLMGMSQANAQNWPQSEDTYRSTQQSPQWIEQKAAPSVQQNTAPMTQQAPAPQFYGQPMPYGYGAPMNGYPGYPAPAYGGYGYPGYPVNNGYGSPQGWNNGPRPPFFGNNGFGPWNGSNFPQMPDMGNMPNMEMPSPSFTFPTMNMPFWN